MSEFYKPPQWGDTTGNPKDSTVAGIEAKDVNAAPVTITTVAPISAAEAAKLANTAKNNAATVGDVLNAGWNLQGNGSAVDFVKPYDTVNFVDGVGTTVEATSDGATSVIKVNTVMQYTDANGNPVKKIGDNYYPNDVVVAKDGKAYPAGTQLDQDGNVAAGTQEAAPVTTVQINTVNPDGTSTTATKLGNVDAGSNTYAGDKNVTKVGDKYYNTADVVNGVPKENAQPLADKPTTNTAFDGLANLDASNPTNVMTVADAKNLGWVVSASGNSYADDVRNANQVDFVGTGLATVKGETKDGIRTITVDVNAQNTVEAAQTPVVYTDAEGNKLTKAQDGNFYKPSDIQNLVFNPVDKKYYPAGTTFDENGNTVAQAIQESGFTVGKETDTSGVDFNNSDEKVNPNDELRFADGKGTTVSTGTVKTIDPNGEVSTKTVVKVDVDTGVITNNANGSLKGIVSAADAKKLNDDLAKAQDALAAIEKLGENAPQNVKDAAKAAVYDAEKAIEKAGLNKVATVQNVADAINQSGWNAAVANVGSGVSVDKGGDALVNPGDTVTMTAGNNMQITKDGLNYTIETQKDVTFNSVTADTVNIGPVTLTGRVAHNPDGSTTNELSVGSPSSPTRITNVAPGVNDTDAVNVSQLKGVQNNINQRFGDVYQKMDREHKDLRAGIAGAAALAGIPEVHVAGRSMIAAAASAYKSENAVAVGYSRLSDNSKIKLKLTGSANTRGDVMGTVGVGYMW